VLARHVTVRVHMGRRRAKKSYVDARANRVKMYEYKETYGFDLVVVALVAVVMPIGVLLMQSRRATKRCAALVVMLSALLYIAIFEHYRLYSPEITAAGVRRTFFDPDDAGGKRIVDMSSHVKFGVVETTAGGASD